MIFVNKNNLAGKISVLTFPSMLIVIFILTSIRVFPQSNLQKQFEYALKLYNEEKYFDAINEFKRLQFFDSLNLYSFLSSKLIGMSYKQGGKFNEAIKYFSLAEFSTANLDSLFEMKIEVVTTNLLRRTTYRAFDLLNELKEDARFADKKDQIIYWHGWAYIFNDEWEKASEEFAKLDINHELKQLSDNVSESQYSVNKAKILSYILPGSGQFYTGNYFSGILSLGWVGLWTYISVQALLADRIFDGLMISDFLAFRFYNGNLQNAEKFAVEHNSEVSNWMLSYLQRNFRGPKP